MPVNVIGTLKPKNNGKFPVAEAVDIKVTDDLRLDKALENKADLSSVNYGLNNKADKTTIDNLQNQINNIIEPVTQDAEVQNARVGYDSTSYSTLKQRLDTEATGLKTKIDSSVKNINSQIMQIGENISPSNVTTNYKLVGDGTCISDSNAKIKKYAVTEGNTMYLKIEKVHDGVYQWQDSAIIPTSNPTHLISSSTEAIDDFVVVPTGATYLMVSEDKSGTTNIIAEATSKVENQEEAIEKIELEKVSSRAIKYGYLIEKNNKSLWEQGHLTDSGENGDSMSPYYHWRIRTKTFISSIDCLAIDSGYFYMIYRYNMDGTFVDYTRSNSAKYDDFDFETYKYRIVLGKDTGYDITVDEYSAAYFLDDSSTTRDIFDKSNETDFGVVGSAYYKGLGSDYSNFNESTLYSEVVTAFDTISELEKSELGLSSDNQTIVGYTYTPKRTGYYNKLSKKLPKIIIISAQHGFEKSSVYGLYYFLKDLTEKYDQNELLSYIHDNVQLVIVPVCNPYGFDHNDYLNANGVNLNRNYLCDAWVPSTPGTSQYGGAEPFSEPETQIIRDLVLANKDAYLFFDYHTNGSGAINENRKINWHSYRTSNSGYYNKMKYASARHITRITSMFAKDYNIIFGNNEVAGYIDDGNSTASSEKWAYDNGIIGITFEGFNGFKGETAFTEREKKANSELIGNFLAEALRCYSNELY